MRALVAALAVFLLATALQVVVWRWRRPAGQYAALLGLHLAVVAGASVTLVAAPSLAPAAARLLPNGWFDYANFLVLEVSLLVAYATIFSAVQADSPTMIILLRVEAAGARGVSRADLLTELTDELLVGPRLEDLLTGGLARREGGRYVIGPRGALFAGIVGGYRSLLGMERGG